MSYKAKCSECDKVFTKKTQTRADQALRLHVTRAHTEKGKMMVGKPRRSVNRRSKCVENMHFCPRCGLNLQTLAVAMLVAER